MKSFLAASVLMVVGTLLLFSYDDADDDVSFPPRLLQTLDPKDVEQKLSSDDSDGKLLAPDEWSDINIWGTPARLTSFGYKWVDGTCATDETSQPKKRAALCLYGGISPYAQAFAYSSSRTPDISDLSNVDWAAALYDKNLLPEGDFELDLFIHNWSETYYCTIARSFDGTRFTLRSIIAESNERHMNELFGKIKHNRPWASKQLSMYFSMNKVLALALDYSAKCGFEYDLLITARPDVLLGKPLAFYDEHGEETLLHRALAPHNEVLHSYVVNEQNDNILKSGDFHYVFNPTNARTFVERMFPPPDQQWPDIRKMKRKFKSHNGAVQEFAWINNITCSNDGLGPPNEEVVRKIWDPFYPTEERVMEYLQSWRNKLEFLGLPDHCFPSAPDGWELNTDSNGWKRHADSKDPQCFPKYYDAESGCPPNQNNVFISTTA